LTARMRRGCRGKRGRAGGKECCVVFGEGVRRFSQQNGKAPRWFKCIRPEHPAHGGVMLCMVQCRPASACAMKSPSRGCTLKKQDKTRKHQCIRPEHPAHGLTFFVSLFSYTDLNGSHAKWRGEEWGAAAREVDEAVGRGRGEERRGAEGGGPFWGRWRGVPSSFACLYSVSLVYAVFRPPYVFLV